MNGVSTSSHVRLRKVVGWTTVLFWGAMMVGTHVPLPQLGELPRHSDKLLHFAAYAGLSFLLGWWRFLAGRELRFLDYAAVFGVTAVYSVVDELLQMIPVLNRSADVLDAVADWTGSLGGLLALFAVLSCRRRFTPR